MGWFAALAPIIASMAGGAASSAVSNATKKDGSAGYDMPMMDRAPWDVTNQKLSAKLAQNSALNSMAGRLDPGAELLLNKIRQEQLRASKEQMYGRPGQRGGSIMDNTMAMGTMGGVGPKAMMAKGSRAMQDYASRNAQIQNYIDTLKFSGLSKGKMDAFNMMQTMPRSHEIPYQGQTVSMGQPAQPGMDLGLGGLDYQKLMAGLFNNNNQSQTVNGYGPNTPAGVVDMGTYSRLPGYLTTSKASNPTAVPTSTGYNQYTPMEDLLIPGTMQ